MKKIISIENLHYSIPYSDTILEDINLEIGSGEFIGILGHNGAGKTTFMDILMGFRGATGGKINVLDENPHSIHRANKAHVVFLSQEVTLKGNISIGEFLKYHASFYKSYSVEEQDHLLEVFGLTPDLKIGALSTGQQKKVQVIAGLSCRPKLVLIDEITAVMDPETRQIFFNEIERVRKTYETTVLLATNIAEDLIDRADKIIFVEDKKAKFHPSSEIPTLFNISKAS